MCFNGKSEMKEMKISSVKVTDANTNQLEKKEKKNADGGSTPRQFKGILKKNPKGKKHTFNKNKEKPKC